MHSLFLLRLSEELPAALTHALHALCDPESMRGLDLGETRAQLVARRERLILEQEQAAQVLCPSFPLRLIFWTFYSRAHVPMGKLRHPSTAYVTAGAQDVPSRAYAPRRVPTAEGRAAVRTRRVRRLAIVS